MTFTTIKRRLIQSSFRVPALVIPPATAPYPNPGMATIEKKWNSLSASGIIFGASALELTGCTRDLIDSAIPSKLIERDRKTHTSGIYSDGVRKISRVSCEWLFANGPLANIHVHNGVNQCTVVTI